MLWTLVPLFQPFHKLDCIVDIISWGEFDRMSTRRFGEVRATFRTNFLDGTNADTNRGWYLMSSFPRITSRNDYVEVINREEPYGIMWLKFWSC